MSLRRGETEAPEWCVGVMLKLDVEVFCIIELRFRTKGNERVHQQWQGDGRKRSEVVNIGEELF